jgi:hypothetical protein
MSRLVIVVVVLLTFVASEAPAADTLFPWNKTPDEQNDTGFLKQIDDWLEHGNPERLADSNLQSSRFRNNLRMTVDLAGRSIVPTRNGSSSSGSIAYIGLDVHKVFTDDQGDYATLIAQPYLTKLNSVKGPHFFEGNNDWELVNRIMNVNFTRVFDERMNIKVGHFEVPYGLEQPLNTNGTLRDLASPRNLGVKADWGVTLNGTLTDYDYEIGVSRGTGNEFFDSEDPYVVAGRLGTKQDENLILGVSFFKGSIWNPGALNGYKAGLADASGIAGNILDRERYGFDIQYHFERPMSFLAEFNWGKDYERDVFNSLLELDFYNPSKSVMWFTQFHYLSEQYDDSMGGWEDFIDGSVGWRWTPNNNWALSVMYVQELSAKHPAGVEKTLGSKFIAQLRFRF